MYSTDMPKKVPFTQARAGLSDLLDEVERSHEHVEITRNGRSAAVLMSPEEYEVIQETLEILGDPETSRIFVRAKQTSRRGDFTRWTR